MKESISACIRQEGEIAKVVLMPGDPLRAKKVAETYLEDPQIFNRVRNMYGYTGLYKGKQISVMGSGMGIPSMGLYATELYQQFDVDAIIRIGSAGSIHEDVKVRDLVVATAASSNSAYGSQYPFAGTLSPVATYSMVADAVASAKDLGYPVKVGPVYCSDHFYNPVEGAGQLAARYGHLCVEMETAGLFWTAMACQKKAVGILTISDSLVTGEALSAEDRQNSFDQMMEVALETAWKTLD